MITHRICSQATDCSQTLRIGFSVWARSPPKEYLSAYPNAFQEIRGDSNSAHDALLALVDDIWPRMMLSRTPEEQKNVSDQYAHMLPRMGFTEVHLVSEFSDTTALKQCMYLGEKVTLSEFYKLLPQSKKVDFDRLTMVEILGFLWHVNVVQNAIDKYGLTGIIAGIRSEFFYLTARKLLSPHDLYFVETL